MLKIVWEWTNASCTVSPIRLWTTKLLTAIIVKNFLVPKYLSSKLITLHHSYHPPFHHYLPHIMVLSTAGSLVQLVDDLF